MKAALVQITASDDPAGNLPVTEALIREAADHGAHNSADRADPSQQQAGLHQAQAVTADQEAR